MVYYCTSCNIKRLRNIILDFGTSKELSSYEYMKVYIENCPDAMEDSKISWIVENFLSFQKHNPFLKKMVFHISEELSEKDQEYFMILLNVVVFHLTPSDMHLLYKCIYNLSKPLLHVFTSFLSNSEVLIFVSQVAHTFYDTNFTTEKIISPLFTWQPYLSEMAHTYAQYVKKTDSRKIKLPTIPVQPNVLNRKGKNVTHLPIHSSTPIGPPNSLYQKGKKMLTKDVIDEKLKQTHEMNKQKGLEMLKQVKANDYPYARGKSDNYYQKIFNIQNQNESKYEKTIPKSKQGTLGKISPPTVKETATTIKRMNKRMQVSEKEEVQWLQNLLTNCRDTMKIEKLEEYDRQEKKRERLLDVEKKHLMVQIFDEDAVIAKKNIYNINAKKYQMFLREKKLWDEEIERWKIEEMEKNRKQVEKLSLIELEMLHAKHNVAIRNREIAVKTRKESDELISKAIKEKQEYLECRIKIIKEIKVLALIAKKAKVPKIIDLTESSGLGLLCEMSIAELHERLTLVRIGLKEELEKKKKLIKDGHLTAKCELENVKKNIKNYIDERSRLRKPKKMNIMKITYLRPKR